MSDTADTGNIDIKKLYEDGMSLSKLGIKLGLSTPTVKLRLIEAGAKIRVKVPCSKKRYGFEECRHTYTDLDVDIDEDIKTAIFK